MELEVTFVENSAHLGVIRLEWVTLGREVERDEAHKGDGAPTLQV